MMDKYNLWGLVYNIYLYIEIRKGMYGFLQADRLANDYLKEQRDPFCFYECEHTSSLRRHKSSQLVFTLWVDDFGVQYATKGDVDYFLHALTECKYVYTAD